MSEQISGVFDAGTYRTNYRIYYEDTDAAGVVYYANYLKFAERARTDALRFMGISQEEMLQTDGLGFVVRRVSVDYRAPARLDDLVMVETSLASMGKARCVMDQLISLNGRELVHLTVEIAMVNAAFKPARIPEKIRGLFVKYLQA